MVVVSKDLAEVSMDEAVDLYALDVPILLLYRNGREGEAWSESDIFDHDNDPTGCGFAVRLSEYEKMTGENTDGL